MSSKDDQRILSKLKYLRQEDKALQDIETKLKAQLNRLKQEERVLRQQMRQSSGEAYAEQEYGVQQDVDDKELMNKKPLMDLNDAATSILQMCQAQFVGQYVAEEEEEEEEENEEEVEEEEGDGEGSIEQEVGDELGAAYQKLFKEMQAEMDYDDDDEFDDT
ncbi:uncharacterized protein [Diadema antillarum]|uniref:uncharacterized protein n=1 Tax=Diadema antillarum TaxID=105358 RepID=UPI003A8C216B